MTRSQRIFAFLVVTASAPLFTACSGAPASDGVGTSQEAVARSRATIVTAEASLTSGSARASVSIGFSDSSFDYPQAAFNAQKKDFCYAGDGNAVCAQVAAFAARSRKEAEDGAHDLFELTSCTTAARFGRAVVSVAYRLTDDYGGDTPVTRDIGDCQGYGAGTVAKTSLFNADVTANGASEAALRASAGKGFIDAIRDAGTGEVAICYAGPATDVCAIVADSAAALEAEYTSGGHQSVEIGSCAIGANGAVDVAYTLIDDYAGTKAVTRTIAACTKS